MKKITTIILALFLIVSCSRITSDKTVGKTPAKMGALKIAMKDIDETRFIADLAKEKGIFKRNGLDPQLILVDKGTEKLLLGGKVDVKLGSTTNALSLYLNGKRLHLIGTIHKSFVNFFASPYDLESKNKIKRIGINNFGNDSQYMTMAMMKSTGLDASKIELISMGQDSAKLEMLNRGKIDMAFMGNMGTMSKIPSMNKIFPVENDIYAGYTFNIGIITSEEVMKTKKEELGKFMSSMYEAVNFAKNNKKDTIAFIHSEFGYDKKFSEKFYDLFLKSLKGSSPMPKKSDLEGLKELMQTKDSSFDDEKDISGFMDPSFLGNSQTILKNIYSD